MSSELLCANNFMDFCRENCDRRLVTNDEELAEDLQSIKYIKKLITRYKTTLELKERLILNHITLLNNIFGPEATSKILYYKMRDDFTHVRPFLDKMNLLPRFIYNVGDERIIDTSYIKPDETVKRRIENL